MSNVCKITPTASRDIEGIADYLAKKASLTAAERFLAKVNEKFKALAQFPNLGRKREELYPDLRSLPLEDYLIFYRLVQEEIEILRVVSGDRDLKALFIENDEC
jgi:toxin ParE1/3/4